MTDSGTVWSLPPVINRSGPPISLAVSTLAGEWGLKLAAAASNSGLPGAGIVHFSNSESDSSSEIALPNAYRNCSAVSETALWRLPGFLNTGRVARKAESGSGSTPLICASSIATAARARSWPSSFCAIIPPKEWPTRIGLLGKLAMRARVVGDDVVDAVIGDGARVGPGRVDGPGITRPAGRCRFVAGLPEQLRPWLHASSWAPGLAGGVRSRRRREHSRPHRSLAGHPCTRGGDDRRRWTTARPSSLSP